MIYFYPWEKSIMQNKQITSLTIIQNLFCFFPFMKKMLFHWTTLTNEEHRGL